MDDDRLMGEGINETDFINELAEIFSSSPSVLDLLKGANSSNPSVLKLIQALSDKVKIQNGMEEILEKNESLKKMTIESTNKKREQDNINYGPKTLI